MHKKFPLGLFLLPTFLFAQQIEPLKTFVQFTSNPIEVTSFSPDEKTVIGGDSEGHLYFWNVDNGSLVKIVRAHKEKINALSISSDGKYMVTAGNDNKIITWDLTNWDILNSVEVPKKVSFIAFSQSNTIYYIDDFTLYKTSLKNPHSSIKIYDSSNSLTAAAINSNLNMIGLASGKFVYLINLQSGSVENKISCCNQTVTNIDFFKSWLSYKCIDGTLAILQLETEEQQVLKVSNSQYSEISFSNDGAFLVEGNVGNTARLWDIVTREEISELKGHKGMVSAFDFSKDDAYILTGSHDGTLSMWNLEGKRKDEGTEEIREKRDDAVELIYSEQKIPTHLNGRSVETQQTAEINSPKLDVFVWDNENVDGDIISLNFNGDWILKDYSVTKIRKKLSLNLNPNSNNYLILYAHNLGRNPPNTAAISFVSESSEKILTVNSDLKKCGAVNFVFK